MGYFISSSAKRTCFPSSTIQYMPIVPVGFEATHKPLSRVMNAKRDHRMKAFMWANGFVFITLAEFFCWCRERKRKRFVLRHSVASCVMLSNANEFAVKSYVLNFHRFSADISFVLCSDECMCVCLYMSDQPALKCEINKVSASMVYFYDWIFAHDWFGCDEKSTLCIFFRSF